MYKLLFICFNFQCKLAIITMCLSATAEIYYIFYDDQIFAAWTILSTLVASLHTTKITYHTVSNDILLGLLRRLIYFEVIQMHNIMKLTSVTARSHLNARPSSSPCNLSSFSKALMTFTSRTTWRQTQCKCHCFYFIHYFTCSHFTSLHLRYNSCECFHPLAIVVKISCHKLCRGNRRKFRKYLRNIQKVLTPVT